MKIIEFNKVSKYYGNRQVIKDFSLCIEDKERIVILGPSGCGKTTILRLLAGFIAPDSGSIIINSKLVSINKKIIIPPEKRDIGMVFQDLALWPHLTVKGNLEFGLKAKGIKKIDRERRIHEMLNLIQMEEFINAKPAELSGGQQQRIALARALILHPKILVMDEPLSSLDIELNIYLQNEIIRLQQYMGFSLVYVTHNYEEAFNIGSQIVIIKEGRIIKIGKTEEIKDHLKNICQHFHVHICS